MYILIGILIGCGIFVMILPLYLKFLDKLFDLLNSFFKSIKTINYE